MEGKEIPGLFKPTTKRTNSKYFQ